MAIVLAACAATEPSRDPADKAAQAATAPLSDLNLVRANIPPPLVAALKAPYARPADGACAGLTAEVEALDVVLGTDLDAADSASNPSVIERGVTAVGDAAIGVVRGAAEGVVPMRSWVRKLSGAERHSKEVAAAVAAGVVRRSFLKGLGDAGGCEAPAAPRR
ncbi:MAG: hypothetical protein OEO84_00200 [Betaproteobacteria bacterium]|nr:hypothetical protein [Betaproteobacteria bacterium]